MSTHSPDTNYQPSPRQADVFAGYDTFQLHSLGIDISSLPENELNWYTDLRSCSRRISNMLGLHVPELD